MPTGSPDLPDLPRNPRCAGCNQETEAYWLVQLRGDHDEGAYAVLAVRHVRCHREWGWLEDDGWLLHLDCE